MTASRVWLLSAAVIALTCPGAATVAAQVAPRDASEATVVRVAAVTAGSIYGAVVEVDFQAADIGQTTRLVRVMLDVNELARTTINFAQID